MVTRAFFTFFPPPHFLRMPYVGIDVSDEAVRFVELVDGKSGRELGAYAEKALPEGAIEAGYINNPEAVTKVLRELKKEFGLHFVRASLPEEKVYLFKTSIPRVGDSEIRSAIELRLEENVPIPPAQAIFDYEIMHGEKSDASDTIEVSVSVLPEKVVTTYMDVFNAAGLVPVDFEIEGRAIARAFVRDGDRGTYMVVNFTEQRTGVFIVSDGVVRFSSTLAIGGSALTRTLAQTLSISLEEADSLKRDRGQVNKDSADVFDASLSTLSALKDEVNKILVYWHTHSEQNKKIEKIILSGENSCFTGFDKYLALSLNIAVEQGNPWTNAFDFNAHIPQLDARKALDYAIPIGLALPPR